jgi:hypothetical protein
LAREGVTFPNGESVTDGAIGFVKGIVYLQQAYFMFNTPSSLYNTQLETSHYANMFKIVANGNPPTYFQGMLSYPQFYQTVINPVSAPLGSGSYGNGAIDIVQGSNQGILNFFNTVFNADNSVFHIPSEEISNILIIEAEVII